MCGRLANRRDQAKICDIGPTYVWKVGSMAILIACSLNRSHVCVEGWSPQDSREPAPESVPRMCGRLGPQLGRVKGWLSLIGDESE